MVKLKCRDKNEKSKNIGTKNEFTPFIIIIKVLINTSHFDAYPKTMKIDVLLKHEFKL